MNLTRPKSQNIEQIQPFSVYDSHNSNSFNHKNSFDSYRSSVKSSSIIDNENLGKLYTDLSKINRNISIFFGKKPLKISFSIPNPLSPIDSTKILLE